ncbi:MAG TPA: MFS transporter [Acidimicrobiales bacterium]|nr:MFS transporter [Acidimicrobiales bacterium]
MQPDDRSGGSGAGVAGSRLGGRYQRLWTASTISNLGDGVAVTALPLLATTLTRDPFLVALLHFAQFAPWLLFSLVSGALVDRWDRRHVMWRVDLFRAGVVGALALLVATDRAGLPLLFVAAFLLGTAETLFDNASQAILPSLVERRDLAKANGRLFGAQIVTNQFAGPPLGGFLFAALAAAPFLFDAGSFVAAAVLVALIPGMYRTERAQAVVDAGPDRSADGPSTIRQICSDIAEGLRWLWQHRLLRTLALALGATNLLYEAAMAVMVLFAQDVLGLGETGYGLLLTSFAVGSVIASMVSERLIDRYGPGGALTAALVVFGLGQIATGLSSSPWVVGAIGVAVGFATIVWNVITVSLRQAIIPDEILGRVNSTYRFIGWGAIPLGALAGGLLADQFGLRAPFLVGGVGLLVAALLMAPIVSNGSIAEAEREAADRLPVAG